MSVRARIRSLFRLFLLVTVLAAVALISAVTTIRLSIRGHQETMPNLVSVPLDKAQSQASNLGLVLKVADKIFSSRQEANHIVSQEPPAGTPIKVGQHVHVLVSLGPQLVEVPNTVGSSLRAAQITAVQRGLTVGSVTALPWAGAEPDRVLAQDPPPLTANAQRPAINLLVSTGDPSPAYVCPRFVGQPLSDVVRAIEGAGLKVAKVTALPAEGTPEGTVLAQTPPPGSKLGPETLISFQVAE